MKLLIVEDDAELVLLLRHFLDEMKAVHALICDSTDAAKDVLSNDYQPDAALVDFSAKGRTTSVELCRHLSTKAPLCRVHLMSGIGTSLMKTATRGLDNIINYYEKPFSVQEVVTGIIGATESDGEADVQGTNGTEPADDKSGFAEASLGQLQMLRRLLEEDPNDVASRQILAFSLYTAGRYRDALKEYDKVAGLGPPSYLSLYYHGHTCARLHLFRDAIKLWEQALEKAPSKGAKAKIQTRISQAEDMHRMERELRDTDPRRQLKRKTTV